MPQTTKPKKPRTWKQKKRSKTIKPPSSNLGAVPSVNQIVANRKTSVDAKVNSDAKQRGKERLSRGYRGYGQTRGTATGSLSQNDRILPELFDLSKKNDQKILEVNNMVLALTNRIFPPKAPRHPDQMDVDDDAELDNGPYGVMNPPSSSGRQRGTSTNSISITKKDLADVTRSLEQTKETSQRIIGVEKRVNLLGTNIEQVGDSIKDLATQISNYDVEIKRLIKNTHENERVYLESQNDTQHFISNEIETLGKDVKKQIEDIKEKQKIVIDNHNEITLKSEGLDDRLQSLSSHLEQNLDNHMRLIEKMDQAQARGDLRVNQLTEHLKDAFDSIHTETQNNSGMLVQALGGLADLQSRENVVILNQQQNTLNQQNIEQKTLHYYEGAQPTNAAMSEDLSLSFPINKRSISSTYNYSVEEPIHPDRELLALENGYDDSTFYNGPLTMAIENGRGDPINPGENEEGKNKRYKRDNNVEGLIEN